MIRIIHLSDFHLNSKNLKDWKDYVKEPMLNILKSINNQRPISLVAFTGDMIDKGGVEYKDPLEAFNIFKNEVMNPIISELDLDIKRFIITPGNHDVIRNLDSKREELGNIEFFKDKNNISEFISAAIRNDDFSGMKRMKPFKVFEKEVYGNIDSSKLLTNFGSSFILKIDNGTSVGVSCLNTAWRSYNRNDVGNILIGENQLNENYKFVKNCDIKIAMVHHPLDGLSPVERSIISDHINKYFNILLIGHSHKSITTISTGLTGRIFINVAPSGLNDIRGDSRTFANGFSVIDFNMDEGKVDCEFWRYNHQKIEFVLNTDASKDNDGRSHYIIPTEESAKRVISIKSLISNIEEDHYVEMDDHLMGARAKINNHSIKEAFILPPIDQGDSTTDENTLTDIQSITQIIQNKSNLMFFGHQEAGKTTLLFRLVRAYIDEFEYIRKIPVYLNFEEIKTKNIITCIREYLRCSVSTVKGLLVNKQIVLLLDNLTYKKGLDKDKINKLHAFVRENQEIQIISTSEPDFIGLLPADYIELCRIPFLNFFIRNLGYKEIKSLMKLWLPSEDDIKTEDRLDKLVKSFNSFSLPSNAMSVSLFIWGTEYSKVKPINNAVLMEIYIEIILEKLSPENIYRASFDFKNKIQLLAKIAQEMLIENKQNYSILYSQFVGIIEDYLKNLVGFTHDPDILIKYFMERKIFLKYHADRIKFTHSCFFNFFIGKRMEFDQEFRVYILDDVRYFQYPKEIDYYTGLTRSDKTTFNLILSRFEKLFNPIEKFWDIIGDLDRYFTPQFKNPNKSSEPIAKKVEIDKIVNNRPSEELMEKYYNQRISEIPNSDIIPKNDGELTLERLIVIMANVLRNSEGVEDLELKKYTYNLLIKYTILYMALYRESILAYIKQNRERPPIIPSNVNLDLYLKNIPYFIQVGLSKHLGTQKLSSVIVEKMKNDKKFKSTSNIEAFLSVGLYSDMQGVGFEKYFKKLIKQLKTNVDNYIVADFCFYKLTNYYYRRTRTDSDNEAMYLDLLAELRIKTQNLPRKMKEKIIKMLSDGKNKYLKSH